MLEEYGRLSDGCDVLWWVDNMVVVDERFIVYAELYSLVGVEKGVSVEIISLVATTVF